MEVTRSLSVLEAGLDFISEKNKYVPFSYHGIINSMCWVFNIYCILLGGRRSHMYVPLFVTSVIQSNKF